MEETTAPQTKDPEKPAAVIKKTIPLKPLPDTSGFPWALYATLLSLFGGIVAWRLKGRS